MSQDKAKTLDEEGVKAFKVRGTAYAASAALDGQPKNSFFAGWQKMLQAMRSVFEKEVDTQAEKDALAKHWADLSVVATFSVDGGMRGEPIVLQSLEGAAKEIQDQAPVGADVVLVTKKGNEIGVDALTLKTRKNVKRLKGQNALDFADAWAKLFEYRQELMGSGRWKK